MIARETETDIDIGDCRLHVVDIVPDGLAPTHPVLLMLHGGPGFDHTGFRPDFDRFADRMRVIYVDQRGQGRSAPSHVDHWCLDVWADDVVRLCDALEVDHPIVLGQSFGGMVAMHYAARHPAHPSALVLSSTSARMHLHERILPAFEAAGGARAGQAARRFLLEPDRTHWADFVRHCLPLYNTTPQEGDAGEPRFEVLCHFFAGEAFSMDLRPGLARVRAPVLVLWGEHDPITPPQDARDIVSGLAAAAVQASAFAGAGHGAWRDQPGRYFEVLDAFFADLI